MANIKKFQNQGTDIYPVTHEDAVFDSNGVTIGQKIVNLNENKANKTEIPTKLSELENDNNSITKDDMAYISVKDFGAVGDGVTDDTNSFKNALSFVANENNMSLYIPSGKYMITEPIEQWFSYAPKIFGDGQEKTMILPNNIPEGDVVFKFYGKQFTGGSIQGLRLTDFTINMTNSNAHAIQLSSLHDMNKIDSISITNVYGHALILTSNHSSDSISYNCSESLLIINCQFKGRNYDENSTETNYALLKAKPSDKTDVNNMVNEVVIMACRFYGQTLTSITNNNMPLNKRSAIEISTYAVGWSIHDCMFNTIYGAPAILLGKTDNDTCISRGHRIFSNTFENCGSHGEYEDTIDYNSQNCVIAIFGKDYQQQNNIMFNRFEKPIQHKCIYCLRSSGNHIYEPGLNPMDVYSYKGSNQIIALGNASRDNSIIPGNQYKNTYMGSYGEYTVYSSKLMVASRNDVVSGDGIKQETKPELIFGCNISDTQKDKTCGFRMINEHYEAPKLAYIVDGIVQHTFNSKGTVSLKNLEEIPDASQNSIALINNELKIKKGDGNWYSFSTEEQISTLDALTLNGYSLWVGTTEELEAIEERDANTLYFEIDNNNDDENEVVQVNVIDGILTLTKDKYQKTIMENETEIIFPEVNKFTEIHLYFDANDNLSLIFSDCKLRGVSNIETGNSYEIIATYNTMHWLVDIITYS